MISYFFYCINLFILFYFIIFRNKIKNNINNNLKEYEEKELNKIELIINNKYIENENKYKKEKDKLDNELEEKRKFYNNIIKENENIIKREEEKKNLILNQKKEIIDKELEQYKIQKEYKLNKDFEFKNQKLIEEYLSYEKINNEQKEELNKALEEIKNELEDYRRRREVVNEAIIREKEIQEKETFYKINITQNDIEDIEILKTIESKLKNKEALNKLIYDVYISKPVKEMIKRVLNGGAPSGIYKITYLPTGESYIGKSTNIKNRWEQHCKSCFGLGNISHSSLHTKMARDGIWNFSFEVLEEVSKENLSEREKYYIKFYDTVKFGMNEKVG